MIKKHKIKLLLCIVIILQSLIFIAVGSNKAYIHMDEAYSFGLSNYHSIDIQMNGDFFNNWHTKDYYNDYLVVNEDERLDIKPVYENQKNDVHPPFYYLLLRVFMGFGGENFSVWTGISLNIIIYAFITLFLYLLLKLLIGDRFRSEILVIIAFVASVTLSSLAAAVYVRMYALSTLNILMTAYFHMKLVNSDKRYGHYIIGIAFSALLGSLTHYYYLFFLAAIFVMVVVKFLREKQYKKLAWYFGFLAFAGALSLGIFPYSLEHMFMGYRGQGAMQNMKKPIELILGFGIYLYNINNYVFNYSLIAILIFMLVLAVRYCAKKKANADAEHPSIKLKNIHYLIIPTLFYFFMSSVASPWKELRYIMPICPLIFIIVACVFAVLLRAVANKKAIAIMLASILLLSTIAPIALRKNNPTEFYDKDQEIVSRVVDNYNVPALYMYNTNVFRFLDDILLFSKLDESYIAANMEPTDENIQKVFEGKDVSDGIIVVINADQNNDEILEKIKNAMGFDNIKWVEGLNAANVYYLN